MTTRERLLFGLAFIATLVIGGIASAITIDQLWQQVFDSVNNAIRVNEVASGS